MFNSVKMLSTRKGCNDGDLNNVITFLEGRNYEIEDDLYAVFKKNKWCEDANTSVKKEKESEEKNPPENKSLSSAKENKGK